jgi:hypothetical protein
MLVWGLAVLLITLLKGYNFTFPLAHSEINRYTLEEFRTKCGKLPLVLRDAIGANENRKMTYKTIKGFLAALQNTLEKQKQVQKKRKKLEKLYEKLENLKRRRRELEELN